MIRRITLTKEREERGKKIEGRGLIRVKSNVNWKLLLFAFIFAFGVLADTPTPWQRAFRGTWNKIKQLGARVPRRGIFTPRSSGATRRTLPTLEVCEQPQQVLGVKRGSGEEYIFSLSTRRSTTGTLRAPPRRGKREWILWEGMVYGTEGPGFIAGKIDGQVEPRISIRFAQRRFPYISKILRRIYNTYVPT